MPFDVLTVVKSAVHRSALGASLTLVAAIVLVSLLGIVPGAFAQATLHVENNGVDSTDCGTATVPCRSISQAISKANEGDTIVVGPGRYGDLNGDGVLGGPGEESGRAGCLCMIEVNKPLTLKSRDGAGVTVLDASVAGFDGVRAVFIGVDGVAFGTLRHGFTITNARREGLLVQANGVTVAGNLAIANGTNGNDAFSIDGTGNVVIDNVAINNFRAGFGIHGENATVTANVASDNILGFEISSSGQFFDNVVSANRSQGLVVAGASGLEISHNAVVGNRTLGIRILRAALSGEITVTSNNILGNDRTEGNCGLLNATGTSLTASMNYWGAATGPGPDPADAVCNDVGGTTIVDPVATEPFHIKVKVGR